MACRTAPGAQQKATPSAWYDLTHRGWRALTVRPPRRQRVNWWRCSHARRLGSGHEVPGRWPGGLFLRRTARPLFALNGEGLPKQARLRQYARLCRITQTAVRYASCTLLALSGRLLTCTIRSAGRRSPGLAARLPRKPTERPSLPASIALLTPRTGLSCPVGRESRRSPGGARAGQGFRCRSVRVSPRWGSANLLPRVAGSPARRSAR
jgi:hypothetical protein